MSGSIEQVYGRPVVPNTPASGYREGLGPCSREVQVGSLVAVFAIVMGIGIAGLWTMDILRSPEVDRSRGLLARDDSPGGSRLVPHWLAEYATAATLVVAGIGLLTGWSLGEPLALVGLGALAYTSLNSLGWVLARPERRPYGVPMVVGLVGGLASVAVILAT